MLWLEAGTGWLGGCCTFVRMILWAVGGKNEWLFTIWEKRSQPAVDGQPKIPHQDGAQVKLWQRGGEMMNPGQELGAWKSDGQVPTQPLLPWCLWVPCTLLWASGASCIEKDDVFILGRHPFLRSSSGSMKSLSDIREFLPFNWTSPRSPSVEWRLAKGPLCPPKALQLLILLG